MKAQLYGDATRNITGLTLTDHTKWAMLTKRRCWNYQNPRVNLPAYLIYDLIAAHTWGLPSLGKPKHAYGDLLVQIVQGKLPLKSNTFMAWDIDHQMVTIFKQICILETSSYSNTFGITPEHVTSTAAFHVGSKASPNSKQQQKVKNRKKYCILCKSHHATALCLIMYLKLRNTMNCSRARICVLTISHHTRCLSALPSTIARCATKGITPDCSEMVQQLILRWQKLKRLPH